MSPRTRRFAVLVTCLFLVFCTSALAQDPSAQPSAQAQSTVQTSPTPDNDDGWHFTVSPYLWFAGISGTTGVLGHNVSVHASPGDVLSHFDIGLMGAMEVRKKRLEIPLDFMWIKLEADRGIPFDPGVSYAKLKVTQTILTPAIGYRIIDKDNFKVDGRVGLRYWHLGQNLSFQPSGILGNLSTSANWADVVAGAKIQAALTPKVLVTVLGDAGGGGANLDYQVVGLLGLKVSQKIILQAGWRYLAVNYRNSPPQLFVYDVHQSGAILGMTMTLK